MRNPQGLVPTLNVEGVDLSQSPAILEWLEERFPEPRLLPLTALARSVVRSMGGIIACDIHPLNNLRVLQQLRSNLAADEAQVSAWIARWINEGFAALEQLIERHGEGFAFGDRPTLADCYIIPQVYSAERFDVDLAPYPQNSSGGRACRGASGVHRGPPFPPTRRRLRSSPAACH